MSGVDASKLDFQIGRQLMVDPEKRARFIASDTKLVLSGKLKKEYKFAEQYWIPAVNRLELHVITVCMIDSSNDSPSNDEWDSLNNEDFSEISTSDMMDEFVKANPAALESLVSANNSAKELDELWMNFSKKL